MRVLGFSLGPIFPDAVHGGSQKNLTLIMKYLGSLGHECTIFCTQRDDNKHPFQLAKNVLVKPTLQFKQTYPEPYGTSPYYLANIINQIGDAVEKHDRLYINDAQLLYHFLYDDIPTIIAFQDLIYTDTLAGAFSFMRDHLIVPSQYLKDTAQSLFATFRPLNNSIMSAIPNGVDSTVYHPKSSQNIRSIIKLPDDVIPILHPHRPDPRKGLLEAIKTIDRLRSYIDGQTLKKIRLLVPEYIDSQVKIDENHMSHNVFENALYLAVQIGLPDLIFFHPWIPYEAMPAYYSLGVATLCVGSFIESFGYVSVESEMCGTPSIVSRVGAQRSVLPEGLGRKANYGNYDEAAQLLAKVIVDNEKASQETREYIKENYGMETFLANYAERILNARVQPSLPSNYMFAWNLDDFLQIPPWCTFTSDGYYNDYKYGYLDTDNAALQLISNIANGKCYGDLLESGFSEKTIKESVQEGWLVRIPFEYQEQT